MLFGFCNVLNIEGMKRLEIYLSLDGKSLASDEEDMMRRSA